MQALRVEQCRACTVLAHASRRSAPQGRSSILRPRFGNRAACACFSKSGVPTAQWGCTGRSRREARSTADSGRVRTRPPIRGPRDGPSRPGRRRLVRRRVVACALITATGPVAMEDVAAHGSEHQAPQPAHAACPNDDSAASNRRHRSARGRRGRRSTTGSRRCPAYGTPDELIEHLGGLLRAVVGIEGCVVLDGGVGGRTPMPSRPSREDRVGWRTSTAQRNAELREARSSTPTMMPFIPRASSKGIPTTRDFRPDIGG